MDTPNVATESPRPAAENHEVAEALLADPRFRVVVDQCLLEKDKCAEFTRNHLKQTEMSTEKFVQDLHDVGIDLAVDQIETNTPSNNEKLTLAVVCLQRSLGFSLEHKEVEDCDGMYGPVTAEGLKKRLATKEIAVVESQVERGDILSPAAPPMAAPQSETSQEVTEPLSEFEKKLVPRNVLPAYLDPKNVGVAGDSIMEQLVKKAFGDVPKANVDAVVSRHLIRSTPPRLLKKPDEQPSILSAAYSLLEKLTTGGLLFVGGGTNDCDDIQNESQIDGMAKNLVSKFTDLINAAHEKHVRCGILLLYPAYKGKDHTEAQQQLIVKVMAKVNAALLQSDADVIIDPNPLLSMGGMGGVHLNTKGVKLLGPTIKNALFGSPFDGAFEAT